MTEAETLDLYRKHKVNPITLMNRNAGLFGLNLAHLFEERELVADLSERMAFLSGHTAESREYHGASLWGDWQVVAVRGGDDLCEPGDVLTFNVNNELVVSSPTGSSAGAARVYSENSRFDYWATKREVLVPDEDLVARYDSANDTLTLRIRGNEYWDEATIELTRLAGTRPYDDVVVDTEKSFAVYRQWLAMTRPAPGPGGLRRPLWLPRAFKPDASTYRIEG